MEQQSVATVSILRVNETGNTRTEDVLAVEEPLEIRLLYTAVREPRTIAITMRTPGNDNELAAGFLFTEGILQSHSQIREIRNWREEANSILVQLHDYETPELRQADRNFYMTSSCGICGKASIDAVRTNLTGNNTPQEDLLIPSAVFYTLQDALRTEQEVFASTGGLHASALFDEEGNFILLREDVGRHNALDKLIGNFLINNQLPLHRNILLLSGRASFELIQKAAMAGISVVAAVGAPSSLAVQLAQDSGITLVGFLRDRRFNIYTHPQRIVL